MPTTPICRFEVLAMTRPRDWIQLIVLSIPFIPFGAAIIFIAVLVLR